MNKVNQWAEELEMLSSIIAKTPLVKTRKWGTDVYTLNGKNVITLNGFKNHFALWFTNGVFLKDKEQVLIAASEGKTKALRQWRFTNRKELNEKKILEYLQEAIKNEEKGLSLKPEKFTPEPIPELLATAFAADKKLETAFNALTPGRQKEYILYLNEAKMEATRNSRLEKIKSLILQGSGLYDKYK